MAPSAPLSLAKRTLAMVVSVLLPVQPKKIGISAVFIFAVSTMICFFSSGDSIEDSPVDPMIRIAEVPLSAWNFSRVRNAAKSTEPSRLNGVIRATNEPVSFLFLPDISVSIFATFQQFSTGYSAGGNAFLHVWQVENARQFRSSSPPRAPPRRR